MLLVLRTLLCALQSMGNLCYGTILQGCLLFLSIRMNASLHLSAARPKPCHDKNASYDVSHPYGVWEWAAEVQIGTPPETFYLQMDSGYPQLSLSSSGGIAGRYPICPKEVPAQGYHANASSTSRVYSCADAKAEGVTMCINCDGTAVTDSNPCVSNTTGLGDGVNYTHVSDVVRIGGAELPNFNISLTNSPMFRGSFGFKVCDETQEYCPPVTDAPPWSSLPDELKKQGIIQARSYSAAFNKSSGKGSITMGELMPYTVAPEGGGGSDAGLGGTVVTTAEPLVMLGGTSDLPGYATVLSVRIGDVEIYSSSNANASIVLGVDLGSIASRPPGSWVRALRAALEGNCSSNPLVGVCVDSGGAALEPSSNSSILDGNCYALSEEQRAAYPTIVFALPVFNSSALFHAEYSPAEYLTNFGSECARHLIMCSSCNGPDDATVAWSYLYATSGADNEKYWIAGADFYQAFLTYRPDPGDMSEFGYFGLASLRSYLSAD